MDNNYNESMSTDYDKDILLITTLLCWVLLNVSGDERVETPPVIFKYQGDYWYGVDMKEFLVYYIYYRIKASASPWRC